MPADPRRVQKERDALLKLHQINRLISSEQDVKKLLQMIMDHAVAMSRAERGFLILPGEGEGRYDVQVARNIGKEVIDHPMFKVSRGIIDEAWRTVQPVVLENAKTDHEFGKRQSVMNLQLASVACLPLRWGGKIQGVLYLDNRYRKGLFEPGDMLLLELFADEAAAAIAQIRLRRELEESKATLEKLNSRLLERNQDLQSKMEETTRHVRDLETRLRREGEVR